MATLQEALAKKQLVNEQQVYEAQARERQKLEDREYRGKAIARERALFDGIDEEQEERFLKSAGKNSTRKASQVGTKQYYDRFK